MRPADDPQVVAARLRSLGAHRGAAQIIFNAAAQTQAAQVRNLAQSARLGVKPQPQPHAANDQLPAPLQPSDGVA